MGLSWGFLVPLFLGGGAYALSVGFGMRGLGGGAFRVLGQKAARVLPWGLLKEAAIHFYCLFDGSCF